MQLWALQPLAPQGSEIDERVWRGLPSPIALITRSCEPEQEQSMNTPNVKSKTTMHRGSMPGALLIQYLALAALATATSAQTWQTVDDFQYIPPNPTVNFGLAVAPSGTVFASGIGGIGGGYYQGLVMASADGGSTWTAPLDAFTYTGGVNTVYDGGIACDSSGNIYVAGSAFAQPHRWLVRQGTAGGTSWATVDDIQFVGSTGQTAPHGIAADAAGNVYVAGVVQYTNGVTAWTVRKGTGGTSYSTVDSFAAGGYAVAQSVVVAPNGAIFVAGHTNYTATTKHSSITYAIWTVRRSLDGGATWATVDSAIDGQPRGIGADASGNVYVVGESVLDGVDLYNYSFSAENATSGHWLVLRSTDGGNSWATVDDFYPCVTTKTGTQCPFGVAANAFAADAHGNLFVAGCLRQAANASTQQWVVRESLGGTGAWTTVDTFQYVLNQASAPETIAADSFGNVLVGGWGMDSSGVHWLVRRN
jgi:sugar lactone lactonase YvrE